MEDPSKSTQVAHVLLDAAYLMTDATINLSADVTGLALERLKTLDAVTVNVAQAPGTVQVDLSNVVWASVLVINWMLERLSDTTHDVEGIVSDARQYVDAFHDYRARGASSAS